jgi:hypothetical protein
LLAALAAREAGQTSRTKAVKIDFEVIARDSA